MGRDNRVVVLTRRPRGRFVPEDLTVASTPMPVPADGEVLVANTWLSIDPSVRIRLSEDATPGYLPPFELGDTLQGLAIGRVVESRVDGFEPGDVVSHMYGYREYAAVGADGSLGGYGGLGRVQAGDLPLHWFLGPLGSSGLTAYAGVVAILDVGPEDTVWVSAAAGAVGSLAAGLAATRGATVIGSAGGPGKVAYLADRLGLAAAFDYRAEAPDAALARLAPEGIDKYFDNVGGDHLRAAIDHLRPHGRIALCGAMSAYESEVPSSAPDLFSLVAKEVRLEGFRAGSHRELETAMRSEIAGHLEAGRMSWKEEIFVGIDAVPHAMASMLQGGHSGKTLCRLR